MNKSKKFLRKAVISPDGPLETFETVLARSCNLRLRTMAYLLQSKAINSVLIKQAHVNDIISLS